MILFHSFIVIWNDLSQNETFSFFFNIPHIHLKLQHMCSNQNMLFAECFLEESVILDSVLYSIWKDILMTGFQGNQPPSHPLTKIVGTVDSIFKELFHKMEISEIWG